MRVPGWCTVCRRFKQVVVRIWLNNSATGICSDCEDRKAGSYCRYCRSSIACRNSAWTAEGHDLEAFERNHTAERRKALQDARGH